MNRDDRRVTLLCFPHAGGGRLFYERWRRLLEPTVDFRVAAYPHREQRLAEPMPATVSGLVEQLYGQLEDELRGDYVVWGHSMGSVVGYELAKLARERLVNLPLAFFSSGSSAPCDSTFRDAGSLSTAGGLERILRRYGGLDEATLRDPQFMGYFRPIITDDRVR